MWSAVILHRNWTHIKQLDLYRCNITDNNIDTLLKVEWPNLTQLWLSGNEIGDAEVEKILYNKWKQLTFLSLCIQYPNIDDNNISQQGMKMLLS